MITSFTFIRVKSDLLVVTIFRGLLDSSKIYNSHSI